MLKKGFEERATYLKEEISKLQNEKKHVGDGVGQSVPFFKDYVMPFLCPLLEMVPNLLMQRSIIKSLKR